MLRRCVLGLSSSAKSVKSSAKQATAQTPFFLSSRRALSSAPKPNPPKGSASTSGKPSGSGNLLQKLVVGTIVVGAAVGTAYQAGYIGNSQVTHEDLSLKSSKLDARSSTFKEHSQDGADFASKETSHENPKLEVVEEIDESHQISDVEMNKNDASEIPSKEEIAVISAEVVAAVKENEPSSFSEDASPLEKENAVSEISSMDSVEMGGSLDLSNDSTEQNEITFTPISSAGETKTEEVPSGHLTLEEAPKVFIEHEVEVPSSLSELYSLQQDEEKPEVPLHRESTDTIVPLSEEKVVPMGTAKEFVETNESKDQKIVLDFIEVIHAAEKRQAESDFRMFAEETQKLKERIEKELKDAKARELMYAEEAAILEKELNKERVKAAAAAKLLQEKAEENLRMELKDKEEELELKLKEFQELGKAELLAAIAKEKSSHMEKMAEANLHIKALCMAFYARSEEARQSYSIHKLALGALALEDALSKGLPIKEEIDALHSSLVGLERDSLLDLVLSTLPEETLKNGTNTLLQLSQKFDSLKRTLQHFGLIPPGGGGILAHTVAHIAASIKMRESSLSGDGIESVITRVERFLAEGKLAEAADVLEKGVSGTEAEGAVSEWVRHARNRAITEQALTLLQAFFLLLGPEFFQKATSSHHQALPIKVL